MKKKNILFVILLSVAFLIYLSHRKKVELENADNLVPSGLEKQELDQAELSRSEQVSRAVEALNGSMNFYGRVVDQDGNGIEEASITLKVRKGVLAGSEAVDESIISSDSSGNFSARNLRGFRLSLENIEKNGFRLASRQVRDFNYDGGSPVETDFDNPQIFVMIEDEAEVSLAFRKYRILSDWSGEAVFVDLDDGVVESGDSDIEIIAVRKERSNNRYDWEFSVRSTTGGVILAPLDGSPTIAPSTGYADEWSIGYRFDDVDYKGGFNRDSFVKLEDGRYGRINFNVYVDERRASSNVIMRVFVNESGGRILESDTTNSKY